MINALVTLRSATLIFLLVLSGNALAKPTINGISIHSELGSEKFIAALYVETTSDSEQDLILSNENKTMEIRVLANKLYSRKFKQMWIEGIAINASQADMEKHAQDLSDFTHILRVKLRQGDILRINRIKNKETNISINDIDLGRINNTGFFDLMLRTWIGSVPLSSEFKHELLANGKPDPRLLNRFEYTKPTPSRLVQLTRALDTNPVPTETTAESGPPIAATVETPSKIAPQKKREQSIPKPTPPANVTAAVISPKKPPTIVTPRPKPVKVSKPVVKTTPIAVASAPIAKPKYTAPKAILAHDDDIFDNDESESFSADDLLQQQLYISKLTRWTGRFMKYPRSAQRKSQEGTVKITIYTSRDGTVLRSEISDESPHKALNKAALKTIKNASPYPKVPSSMTGSEFQFTVPVVFKLRE